MQLPNAFRTLLQLDVGDYSDLNIMERCRGQNIWHYRVVLVYSFSTCILYTHACIYLCVSVCILVHVCGVLSYEIIHDSARGGLKTALHPIVINSSDCFSPVTACVTTSDTATHCTVHIDPTTPVMFDGDWSLYYTHDDIACMVA